MQPQPLRRRLRSALIAYGALALIAAFTLDGRLRWAILILLGALAFKTWLGVKKEEQQDTPKE